MKNVIPPYLVFEHPPIKPKQDPYYKRANDINDKSTREMNRIGRYLVDHKADAITGHTANRPTRAYQ